MNQAVLNFALVILPTLKKLSKKPKTKGADYIKHCVVQAVLESEIEQSRLSEEFLVDEAWRRCYNMFKEKGLSPSHYRKYRRNGLICVELTSIEKGK